MEEEEKMDEIEQQTQEEDLEGAAEETTQPEEPESNQEAEELEGFELRVAALEQTVIELAKLVADARKSIETLIMGGAVIAEADSPEPDEADEFIPLEEMDFTI